MNFDDHIDLSGVFKKSPIDHGILQTSTTRAECAISSKTRILVLVEEEWSEVNVEDLVLPGIKEYRLLVWADNRFMTAPADKPKRLPVSPRTLYRITFENSEVLVCSPSTQLGMHHRGSDPRAILHPNVADLRVLRMDAITKQDKLCAPIPGGYVLPSSVPELIGTKKLEAMGIKTVQLRVLNDTDYATLYSIRVPYVGNFVLSSGAIVRCNP